MSTYDPVSLLFGGIEKLGPGSNSDTLHVLRLLPKRQLSLVVDAGCGTGRQTLALVKELGVPVYAIDSCQTFLSDLVHRARAAQVEHLVEVRCMDMQKIPETFRGIDLLWSEGAAYNIGFSNALTTWASALAPHGLVVASELSWLNVQAPDGVKEFFRSGYPDMRSVQDNIAVARRAGYEVLATHTLPEHAWVDGYYDILAPRAKALLDHPDAAVRDFAGETLREINVFDRSEGSYGYVFYVLQGA